jgi:hypothetical protein
MKNDLYFPTTACNAYSSIVTRSSWNHTSFNCSVYDRRDRSKFLVLRANMGIDRSIVKEVVRCHRWTSFQLGSIYRFSKDKAQVRLDMLVVAYYIKNRNDLKTLTDIKCASLSLQVDDVSDSELSSEPPPWRLWPPMNWVLVFLSSFRQGKHRGESCIGLQFLRPNLTDKREQQPDWLRLACLMNTCCNCDAAATVAGATGLTLTLTNQIVVRFSWRPLTWLTKTCLPYEYLLQLRRSQE